MSVAAAKGAVSTQQQQPTQEQIRLAQLIEDKKHDHPEVQEIIQKVLDVVENSNQEDALLALFDCDYDCEKAVALLIEKGHDVASEWRMATNHKLSKKQQQKVAATKNGHGELEENGQQRGNDNSTYRNKSRGGRIKFPQNGGDSQNVNNQQQNDNFNPQQRQRGGSSYRGRYRGQNRMGHRRTDRNHQTQDGNDETSSPSDTNRRHTGAGAISASKQQQQDQWDVANWNGETLIYSRTTKDDEQPINLENSSQVPNGQSDGNTNQQKSTKPEFDPIEAARQIKNVIGIGQNSKSTTTDQQQKSKTVTTPTTTNNKITPPPTRIPQQAVIFSDRYDGGMNKIDVQFGNLGESFDETPSTYYQQSDSTSSNKISQRTSEQSSNISPSTTHLSERPVINQQQQQPMLQTQIQPQSSINMKPVVTQQYAVHQQQHQINPGNIRLQSFLFHQQPDPVTLDTSYEQTAFPLQTMDFNSTYFMAAPINQQGAQQRYLVSQPPPQQATTKNAQTSSVPTTTTSTTAKKAPTVPPGMFPPSVQPLTQAAYSTTYGVQQLPGGTTYSTPYDTEHLFTNVFMPLTNSQQAQSPTYGSVTPPVQQQQQQTNANTDNKTMNCRAPFAENLMLIQQYQQFTRQQSNNQQQGQQPATHSSAPLNYFLGHTHTGPSYSPGPPIMYTEATTAMTQQQAPKQQGQQFNPNNSSTGISGNDDYYARGSSSTTNKEGHYRYTGQTQSAGQQQGVNKQQRTSGNVYNNQQGQQRPY